MKSNLKRRLHHILMNSGSLKLTQHPSSVRSVPCSINPDPRDVNNFFPEEGEWGVIRECFASSVHGAKISSLFPQLSGIDAKCMGVEILGLRMSFSASFVVFLRPTLRLVDAKVS